ncbi:carbamoyltransferase HypF [Nocardia seriolae]|uniref:carbamoyltransferase HypF n=1 Tax=Nocardia seriolae TaxID=37332 RepID=UPI000D1246F9|nr:carbamoyltransferase HypF [Nocardia seriolae]PSK29153.1 carbamoyltransferase HypF [Nocardia seriolae]QUN16774.1 carbamoyltransferase HypF [Nocardia seriolae]
MTPDGVAGLRRRARIIVHGIVQGVGFRPFVYRLAREYGLSGDVCNAGGQVVVRVAGDAASVADFIVRLRDSAPPAARVERVTVAALEPDAVPGPDFSVVDSVISVGDSAAAVIGGVGSVVDGVAGGEYGTARLPPDLATCAACARELFDPADRRYRYPFLNCTDCGPRATVIDALPYDRERTAMRVFPMCAACEREYRDPADRRFHAEPICCPDCGPRLSWLADGEHPSESGDSALLAACAVVAGGGIVAVKGVGGFQLVCDAAAAEAVTRLRKAKPRPAKPLAVMVRDLATARTLGTVDELAAAQLGSAAAPIVLLPRRPQAPIAPGVATIGVFLPYSPLHHLLLAELDRPLVVTSGNRGGAPTLTEDPAALRPLADGILTHDRPIRSRYDDSVVRIVAARTITVRRARGFAPTALPLPVPADIPILAVDAQLKHTVAVAVSDSATIGPHLGDLADADTRDAFERSADELCRLHGVRPEFVAHDCHPGYLSTQYARRGWQPDRRIPVQHHHAHVAATAAEHGVTGRFIGIALDGLGFGDDGTLWGGEALLADYTGYRRVARFATAPLPGGEAAVRRPARMALGYLFGAETFGGQPIPPELAAELLRRTGPRETTMIRAMIERDVNCPRASSAGRLFDALAALLGLCDDNTYEGEAAVRLEAAATTCPHPVAPLRWTLHRRDGLLVYDPVPTLRHALELLGEQQVGVIAARFHRTVAEVVVAFATEAADRCGPTDPGMTGPGSAVGRGDTVCLGGGVFQNALLTKLVLAGLAAAGFDACAGERIPMNDGGISYGQAVIAAARTNRRP